MKGSQSSQSSHSPSGGRGGEEKPSTTTDSEVAGGLRPLDDLPEKRCNVLYTLKTGGHQEGFYDVRFGWMDRRGVSVHPENMSGWEPL